MKVKLGVFVDDDSECLSHLANYGGDDSTFIADSL